jgi:patatin-like phospholipase/acyl hydrolase
MSAQSKEMTPSAEATPFRILSLDGGGAKGVYTLGVLKEVEAACNRPLCEIFNLVYGTSTGSIIAALIALGFRVEEIEKLYFDLTPAIMRNWTKSARTRALKAHAKKVFQKDGIDQDFTAFKIPVGIVCANYEFEKPMVFKNQREQAHGRVATFLPGFGCSIADAIVASCAAFPFFKMVEVATQNQGTPLLMDGGYVANDPTLFALADACGPFKKKRSEIAVLSVGVGNYNEPKRNFVHRWIFGQWEYRLIAKMFNTSSKTIEQLRSILFQDVACVRVNESYTQPEYSTDLLESDKRKLRKLNVLGRDSFAKKEGEIRQVLKL